MFLSNQVTGIILNTTGQNIPFIEEISQTLPMVLVERAIDSQEFLGDFIGADN